MKLFGKAGRPLQDLITPMLQAICSAVKGEILIT